MEKDNSNKNTSGLDQIKESLSSMHHIKNDIANNIASNDLQSAEYEFLTKSSPVGIFKTDFDGNFIYANNKISEITGFTNREIIGCGIFRTIHPEDKTMIIKQWQNSLNESNCFEHEFRILQPNGKIVWVYCQAKPIESENGLVANLIGNITDITKIKENEFRLQALAKYDFLTNIPNRSYFKEVLNEKLSKCKRKNEKIAIMYIDIDNFKKVNDTYGHEAGDKLLIKVSQKLMGNIRETDFLARMSGDEFCIIIDKFDNEGEVTVIADRIINAFNCLVKIDEHEVKATLSIGISIYPYAGKTDAELLSNADKALYKVKSLGKNNYSFFKQEVTNKVDRYIKINKKLKEATDNENFSVLFEPIMNINKNKSEIIGFESKIRWFDFELGEINPEEFIPIAKNSILMHDIDLISIEKSIIDFKKIISTNKKLNDTLLALHVSSKTLLDQDFLKNIKEICDQEKMNHKQIIFEIKESEIKKGINKFMNTLTSLNHLGFKISIDSFGDNYSFINEVSKLSLFSIKLDKKYVHNLNSNNINHSIAQSLSSIANDLKIQVIAKGVESKEEVKSLLNLGCNNFQGPYFQTPQDLNAIINFTKQ